MTRKLLRGKIYKEGHGEKTGQRALRTQPLPWRGRSPGTNATELNKTNERKQKQQQRQSKENLASPDEKCGRQKDLVHVPNLTGCKHTTFISGQNAGCLLFSVAPTAIMMNEFLYSQVAQAADYAITI